MNKQIISWLNTWDKNDYNVEIGFSNYSLLKGKILKSNYTSIDEFPNVDFFMQMKTQKPKLYKDVEIEYGCIYCCIKDCKYKIEFNYRTGEYLVTDGSDTIIKRIVVNST